MPQKKPRPSSLRGVTTKQITGHGNLYITITYKVSRKPFETFIVLGKAGSCEQAWIEALARAISIGFRFGVPPGEYIRQLRGIQCGDPIPDPNRQGFIRSPADAIALVLRDFIEGKPFGAGLDQVTKGPDRSTLPTE